MVTSTNSDAAVSASVQASAGGHRTVRTHSSTKALSRNEGRAYTSDAGEVAGINDGVNNGSMGPYINITPPSNRDLDNNPVPHNTPTSSERKKRTMTSQDATEWSPSPPSKRRVTSYVGEDADGDFASLTTLDSPKQLDEDNGEDFTEVAISNIAKLLDFQSQAKLDGVQQTDRVALDIDGQPETLVAGTSGNTDDNNTTQSATNHSQGLATTRIKTLSPHVFTIARNVGKWSKAYKEDTSGTTIYEVIYVPSSDPWIDDDTRNISMDPELADMELYDGLPPLPILQFIVQSTPLNIDVMEVDENGDPIRHAMTVQSWQDFGLTKHDSIRMITFTRNARNGNPSRDSPLHYAAKSYSLDSRTKNFKDADTKAQFFAVDRATRKPVVFWSLGAITSVYLSQPCSEPGRAAYRGIHAVLTGWERDRMSAFFSMVFRNTELNVQMDGNSAYVFHTRFQSKYGSTNLPTRVMTLDAYTSTSNGLRVGQFSIPTYRAPVKEILPPAYYNYGYSFTANIPVYDARGQSFDPMRIDDCLGKLPRFMEDLNEGSCAFIGYGAGTNLYDGKWKISFFIRYLIVVSVPDS